MLGGLGRLRCCWLSVLGRYSLLVIEGSSCCLCYQNDVCLEAWVDCAVAAKCSRLLLIVGDSRFRFILLFLLQKRRILGGLGRLRCCWLSVLGRYSLLVIEGSSCCLCYQNDVCLEAWVDCAVAAKCSRLLLLVGDSRFRFILLSLLQKPQK